MSVFSQIKYSGIIVLAISLSFSANILFAQAPLINGYELIKSKRIADSINISSKIGLKEVKESSRKYGWFPSIATPLHGHAVLTGVDALGFPIYFKSNSNVVAAQTIHADALQPSGELQLNLSGQSDQLNGRIAIWDEGIANQQHIEFQGKELVVQDGTTEITDHTTHEVGTILARGQYAPAKGIAFGLSTLKMYDFNNDVSEMAVMAPYLLLSNHSYSIQAGWNYNDLENRWEWYGLPGDSIDYKFGYYDNSAAQFDKIAFFSPYYLIVQAAGNSRAITGPPIGSSYYGFKDRNTPEMVNKGTRPASISNNNGYQTITGSALAKNNLTVGAIYPLSNGPVTNSDVQIAPFSSWGPTSDGRVKPDICADGVNVISTSATGTNSYLMLSGTSMAAASVTGTLTLLQEYYAKQHAGVFMKAPTLKALVCHTAFDAGTAGPDYQYGWGVFDAKKAAQVLLTDISEPSVFQKTLVNGTKQEIIVTATGTEDIKITLAWNDPNSDVSIAGVLDDHTPKLINDLDMIAINGTQKFYPFLLDPQNPSKAAITGNNTVDNIEQIVIKSPLKGKKYTIVINHKAQLRFGYQEYSLVLSGGKEVTFKNENPQINSINAFPVPAKESLYVSVQALQSGSLKLELHNILGKIVYSRFQKVENGYNTFNIQLNSMPAGIYILHAQSANKNYYQKLSIVK